MTWLIFYGKRLGQTLKLVLKKYTIRSKKYIIAYMKRTYKFFAEKLGIAEITAKKYGKEKCEKLLMEKGLNLVSKAIHTAESDASAKLVEETFKVVGDVDLNNVIHVDVMSRELASVLLYDCLKIIKDLKDSPELSLSQRLRFNIEVARLIAGAK